MCARGAVAAGIAADEFEKLDLVLEEILINVARYAYTPDKGAVEVAMRGAAPASCGWKLPILAVFSIRWKPIRRTFREAWPIVPSAAWACSW